MSPKLKINLAPRPDLTAICFFVLFSVALIISFNYEPIYSLGVVASVFLLFVFAQRPHWGLFLMALLFPFINLQLFIGESLNIPYVDLVAMFVFLGWSFKSIWIWANTGQFIKRKDLPGIGFFLLFIGVSLLSLINSEDPGLSFKYVLRPLAFFYLMFVILPYNLVRTKETLKRVLAIFWFDGMIVSFMGLSSLFLERQMGFLRVVPVSILGVYPLGTNQNLIAETLVVIIPFTGLLVMWTKDLLTKKLLVLSMILMGVVTLGTLSRAGLLSLILQLAVFIGYHFRKNLRAVAPLIAGGLIILLPLAIYFSQLVSSDISRQANENRLLLTRIAFEAFKEHPIIGNGAGIYTRLVGVNRDYIKLFGNPLDSHGVAQKLLAESGLLGLAAFCALVGYIFYRLFKPWNDAKDYETRQILLVCLITVGAGFFFQLFNTSYYVSKLWLPVGIALATIRLIEEKKLS